jgi:hypothetical protein
MSLDTDTGPRLLRAEFILDTSHPIGQASVVGSFNGWTPGLNGVLPEPDGTLSVTIGLRYDQRIVFRHLGLGEEWSTSVTPTRSPRKGRITIR